MFAVQDPFLCRHQGIGLPGCPHCEADPERIAAAFRWLSRRLSDQLSKAEPPAEPIPMRLHCPACHELHIDEGPFATKVHHTHACQSCGMTWRPAVAATVGVRFLPGFKNESAGGGR